jgi:hypothetical protein
MRSLGDLAKVDASFRNGEAINHFD